MFSIVPQREVIIISVEQPPNCCTIQTMTASRVWKNVLIGWKSKFQVVSFFSLSEPYIPYWNVCQYVGVNVLVCPTFLSIYGSLYIVERQVTGWYFDGVVPLWGSIMIRIVLACISQFKHFPVIIFIMAWDKISPSAVATDYCNNSAFMPISQFGEAKVDWCVYYTFCCATGLLHKTGWLWLMLTYLMQPKCIMPSTTN